MESKLTLDIKGNQLKEAKAFKLMLDMHGESKASEVINNITTQLDQANTTIDKLCDALMGSAQGYSEFNKAYYDELHAIVKEVRGE